MSEITDFCEDMTIAPGVRCPPFIDACKFCVSSMAAETKSSSGQPASTEVSLRKPTGVVLQRSRVIGMMEDTGGGKKTPGYI